MRAVPVRQVTIGAVTHGGALDRVAGRLPVGQPALVAADVAEAVGAEGVVGGGGVHPVVVVGVQDDFVVRAQLGQRGLGAGEADRPGDVPGAELPRTYRHDQLDGLSAVQLG